jgi:hypothetical protein
MKRHKGHLRHCTVVLDVKNYEDEYLIKKRSVMTDHCIAIMPDTCSFLNILLCPALC